MNKSLEIITHNQKSICFSDYTNTEGAEFIDCIESHAKQHMSYIQTHGSGILVLTDVTGSIAGRDVMNCLKEKTKTTGEHVEKSAVIGIEGIQKLLLNGVNKFSKLNSKIFSSKEEALNWLTE